MHPARLGLTCLAVALATTAAPAGTSLFPFRKAEPPAAPALPLDELTEAQRALAKPILDRPTLAAKGPAETFTCRPEHYYWLLDHPDRAVHAWRRLGAKCVSITPRGEGQFGWSDDQGSDMAWHTLHQGPALRVWYAEGKVRPGPVLPLVPVKALVVLRHNESKTKAGTTVMKHSADLYVLTDNKTAATLTKLMGPTAPKIAEQGLGQLQLFFSGISWYLDRHPDQVDVLLRGPEQK